ncbi:MAG: Zn-ribbon domain-containing OB-fold protein [Deltaproteobacteria bacterium]|nr:Zn-ribbon domain-containing OB-fold protein [Deltaproteobacteria bacterium]MBW1985180.1 Zn-ribbon domain-containing OB-fold protein [Deltaproteobacteria bacterium]
MSEGKKEKKQLPLKPGIFKIPDDPNEKPYLLGSKCKKCGTHFFPSRVICLNCGAEAMEEASLKGRGTVYTYTIARQQLPGALVQVPYAIAIVLMEEGCQIHTPVTEDWESVKIGMDVEVYFEKVFEDEDGNDLLAYKFRAVKNK